MAQSAVVEPVENEVLNAPESAEESSPDGGRGKPRAIGKKVAQEASEEERTGFFEQTSALTDTQWEHHILYVYQWAPIVDLTKGGLEKKYRRIYTQHRNEEDIKRDLGSGTYQVKLNRTDPKTRKEKTINAIVISILDFEFPPNIPPGAWLDDPRNSDWSWAKPLLEKKFNVNKPNYQNGSGTPTWAEMMAFIEAQNHRREPNQKDQVMSSIVSILPALLQQQNNAQDPAKFLDVLTKMKDLNTPPESSNAVLLAILPLLLKREQDPMIPLLTTQLTNAQNQITELMKQLIATKGEQTKQPSALEQIKGMAEVIQTVSGIVPPATPLEPWQEILKDTIPRALDMGDKFLTMQAMRRPNQPIPGQRPPQGTVMQTPPVTTPTVQVNAGTPPPPPPAAPDRKYNPEVPEMDIMQKSMMVAIADHASGALKLGVRGDEFAERVCDRFGPLTYDEFIQSNSKSNLEAIFRSIPEAWALLAPFEQVLPKFLDDFYAYSEEPEGSDDDAPESPNPTPVTSAPAVPASNKKKGSKK